MIVGSPVIFSIGDMLLDMYQQKYRNLWPFVTKFHEFGVSWADIDGNYLVLVCKNHTNSDIIVGM
jgi:hypothetical protein